MPYLWLVSLYWRRRKLYKDIFIINKGWHNAGLTPPYEGHSGSLLPIVVYALLCKLTRHPFNRPSPDEPGYLTIRELSPSWLIYAEGLFDAGRTPAMG